MLTATELKNCRINLHTAWGEAADRICMYVDGYNINLHMTTGEFLNHCTACGGNWGAMFLTGIKALCPEIYYMIPQTMGKTGNDAFCNLCDLIAIMGVHTDED